MDHAMKIMVPIGIAGDHRGLGRFRSHAPLVSDPQPYPRRGDGSQDLNHGESGSLRRRSIAEEW
jgi:hypothetical protein